MVHRRLVSHFLSLTILLSLFGSRPFAVQAKDDDAADRQRQSAEMKEAFNNETLLAGEASALIAKAQWGKAAQVLERMLPLTAKLHGRNSLQADSVVFGLGMAYGETNDRTKSAIYYSRSLGIREAIHGPKHVDVAGVLEKLGYAYDGKTSTTLP